MSLPPSTSKKSYTPNSKKVEGAKKGKLYEILSLLTLAKRGYELSKHENSKFRDFSVGREIGLGKYRKLDDVVLSYVDQTNTKSLIFLQLKHCQYYNLIDSGVLSTEADRAKAAKAEVSATRVKDIRYGDMCKDFNLQKYFISFLSVRDELKNANTEELKDGKMRHVVLFTNVGLNCKELKEKGFVFKKASGDIVDLFTMYPETGHHCYQLGDVTERLRKTLKKSSDLDRLARELAQYVVCEDHRENRIMGTQETPLKHYHVALEREVVQKSSLKQVKNGQYFREAQFRGNFLDCNQSAPNLHQLRNALYEAVRDLDESKKDADDDELKSVLKEAKWKIVYNFEKNKKKFPMHFPCEWMPVREEDIKDFLSCFVLIVDQPGVAELELLYKHFIQDAVVENTSMKLLVDTKKATGPEFKVCVERLFGLDIKLHNEEKWLSGNQIGNFIKEKQQRLLIIFIVSATTVMYKNEIRQYGKFNNFGKIIENVKNFLTSDSKILCVKTPVTLLTSIKISQHFNTEKVYPISVSLDILNCTENRDCVLKAFELESISLLTIECKHAFNDQDIIFLDALVNTAKTNYKKKIILIMQQENCDICTKRLKADFRDEGICVIEKDSIDLKDFDPKEDPFKKEVILFQGQDKRVSLCDVTGIDSWTSYVHSLSEGNSEQGVKDGMTLLHILSNVEIKVGSKPAGTSSLEGAYAQMYEEINVENLVNKLTSQEHSNNTNDMYVISGISGSSEEEKTHKLIQYLGLDNENEKFKKRLEDKNLQVFDDPFEDEKFQEICHIYLEKQIFWIWVKWENNVTKFILRGIYNPKFYLKRKFKNVIIKKDLKEHLIKANVSEIFIFHCVEDKQELYESMKLNASEVEQSENGGVIRIFSRKSDADAAFYKFSKQNQTVYLFEFEEKQFVWCKSHGSEETLLKYIDCELHETSLIEEDALIGKIKDRKVTIFADDPGMGKTTTLIKLYETEIESSSIVKSHWVIGIKLRDHLGSVRNLQFKKDGPGTDDVIKFLSTVDLKLNNNLVKYLLKIVLDKSKSFQAKPLLLIFDGFDEVLDEVYRHRILLLLQFIKERTTAKMWITTRCHFKELLEETLSTISFQFSPMDDAEHAQYITTYLQHRLYLALNKDKYTDLFDTEDEKQNNEKIHIYTAAFIIKMKSIFKGDISKFIGTPLQLYLMLEGAEGDVKKWIERGEGQIPDLTFIRRDVFEVYENFVKRKYDVYFQKKGFRERVQERLDTSSIDRYHKDFAASKILEVNRDDDFDECKDIFLLVGVIKSQGNDMEFIHKTFEEFFASKVFIDWIKKVPNRNKQEKLLSEILMKPEYRLVRIFMNFQLQKMTEHVEGVKGLDENLEPYGKVAAELLKEIKSPLINEDEKTPLHIAAQEGNKDVACFLLNILKRRPEVLKKFLFIPSPNSNKTNGMPAIHVAAENGHVNITKLLLDTASALDIDDDKHTMKQLLMNEGYRESALHAAARGGHFDVMKLLLDTASAFDIDDDKHTLKQLLSSNDESEESALHVAARKGHFDITKLLLDTALDIDDDKHTLEQLLSGKGYSGSALHDAARWGHFDITKLLLDTASALDIDGDNHTLEQLFLNESDGGSALHVAARWGYFDVTKLLLERVSALDIDDVNHTLKQLLFSNKWYGESALHVAARWGHFHIMKLLLETVSRLVPEILEEIIFHVSATGKDAIQLIAEHGHETTFVNSFKMLEYEHPIIWKKVMERFDNIPLEKRLYWDKKKLIRTIEMDDIQKVKDILSKAKNYRINPNKRLRILLLSKKKWRNSPLHTALQKGSIKIIQEILCNAEEIDDDNHTLKRLLLFKKYGVSALHVAAIWGHFHIMKLLLETASHLGPEILEEIIFDVNERGENALQLMAEHVPETTFGDSFKMLKDEHPIIWKKVMERFDNIPLKRRLDWDKKKLIMAIERGDIEKVENIISNAKNCSINPSEILRILLLSKEKWRYSGFRSECEERYIKLMKVLLSYAMNRDDGGATLKELLTKSTYMSPLTPFKAFKYKYASDIIQIVESLIVEARNNNRYHAVDILEQIKYQYSEKEKMYRKRLFLPSFDSSSSSSEDSDS